jgi:hypothetical protein
MTEVRIDWGDGTPVRAHPAADFAPRPHGAAGHTYALKTCPADYRRTHPSGPNCHPTLSAYPIRVEFVWGARYRRTGTWVELGQLTRTVTVSYDVDEVVGLLG